MPGARAGQVSGARGCESWRMRSACRHMLARAAVAVPCGNPVDFAHLRRLDQALHSDVAAGPGAAMQGEGVPLAHAGDRVPQAAVARAALLVRRAQRGCSSRLLPLLLLLLLLRGRELLGTVARRCCGCCGCCLWAAAAAAHTDVAGGHQKVICWRARLQCGTVRLRGHLVAPKAPAAAVQTERRGRRRATGLVGGLPTSIAAAVCAAECCICLQIELVQLADQLVLGCALAQRVHFRRVVVLRLAAEPRTQASPSGMRWLAWGRRGQRFGASSDAKGEA